MKRILLALGILFSTIHCFSQAQDKGVISIDLGADLGAHLNQWDSKYKGTTVGETDSSGAATTLFRLDAHYNILSFVSAGLHFRTGKYIEDEDNTEAAGNKVNMAGIGIRLYPVNNDKFVWYIGTTLGSSKLEINRKYTFIVDINSNYKLKSSHVGFESGFNWFFAKNFGMNLGLGYSGQKFLLTDYSVNGDPQDLTDWEHILTTKGFHFNIGVAAYFGTK